MTEYSGRIVTGMILFYKVLRHYSVLHCVDLSDSMANLCQYSSLGDALNNASSLYISVGSLITYSTRTPLLLFGFLVTGMKSIT